MPRAATAKYTSAVQPHAGQAETSLQAVQQGDPAAAPVLYAYAAEIRHYLRQHTATENVEDWVLSILIEAVRSIREMGTFSVGEVEQTIHLSTQQCAFALQRSMHGQDISELNSERGQDIANSMFAMLDSSERQILLRSLLLLEDDQEISAILSLPIEKIGRTRAKARLLFRTAELQDRASAPLAEL